MKVATELARSIRRLALRTGLASAKAHLFAVNSPLYIVPREINSRSSCWVFCGPLLLACAIAFQAVFLAPEIRIGQLPLNDAVFHRAAAERLADSLMRGEPFLDPWVSEWSLGYPVWRSYQPVPHIVAAVFLKLLEPISTHAAAFAVLQYLLLVLFPLSIYVGARLLTLPPTAAGLASLLALWPAAAGELGRYGLGYGATVWRGSGLYAQLFALHLLSLSLGVSAQALDSGRHRALASLLLALTALSHLIFGYGALASIVLLAIVGRRDRRPIRLVRVITIVLPAGLLVAWFAVPMFCSLATVNLSRWEPQYKWASFGAPVVLKALVTGGLFDAGRVPVLTFLVFVGLLVALLNIGAELPRRLLALSGLWLALFFGRATWGHLLLIAALPRAVHLHRFQAIFQLCAILLASWGVSQALRKLARRNSVLGLLTAGCLATSILTVALERVRYLNEGTRWGTEALAAFEKEQPDLQGALAEVRKILGERPGRVSAGPAASWGSTFKVGAVPVYTFLTGLHIDQVSFLYHAMSLTSDLMVLRNEADPAHDVLFGVRAVIAPAGRPMPQHLRLRRVKGRFAVYEASPEGYFGLVDVGARYTGPLSTTYEVNAAWLRSPLQRAGVVVALGGDVPGVPAFGRWEAFPLVQPMMLTQRGRILSERKIAETYVAEVALERSCYVLVKITWHSDLVATVDGVRAPLLHVSPGFGAVAVPPGEHHVVVRYHPGGLKVLLLLAGGALFAVSALVLGTTALELQETAAAERLATIAKRLWTSRIKTVLLLGALAVLALRPLFQGRLVDGHDALEYPPRLVEMLRAIRDAHVPPVWAPDLGNGYGQPLFEFAPPLLYLVSLPLHVLGLGLADSLQLTLALLCMMGAVAVYRLTRMASISRFGAVAGVTAWIFSPYLALDLYVRAAFAEAAAVALSPVALLGVLHALDRRSPTAVAVGAAAIALLPLSHNGAALLMIPALGIVAVSRCWVRRYKDACAGFAALAGGLGLSSFFWVPALVEKQYVKVHLLREGALHWSNHAISPLQLLWSNWGYGLSQAGTGDGMSFALGPVHLAAAAAGLVLMFFANTSTRKAEAMAFALAATIGAWLATTWSVPVWSRIETLQYLAFPWRALMLPGLFLPLLAVPIFERLGPRAGTVALGLLVVLNLTHTEPKGYLTFDDGYFTPLSIAKKGLNTTTREEYEPKWVRTRPLYTREPLAARNRPLVVRQRVLRTTRREFIVRADGQVTLEASTFYYPGWVTEVDGVPVPAGVAPGRGTIAFRIPAGEHTVTLTFRPTLVRLLGLLSTLLTLVVLALTAAAGSRADPGWPDQRQGRASARQET